MEMSFFESRFQHFPLLQQKLHFVIIQVRRRKNCPRLLGNLQSRRDVSDFFFFRRQLSYQLIFLHVCRSAQIFQLILQKNVFREFSSFPRHLEWIFPLEPIMKWNYSPKNKNFPHQWHYTNTQKHKHGWKELKIAWKW